MKLNVQPCFVTSLSFSLCYPREKVRNHKSWFLLTVGVQPRSQNALLSQMSDHPLAINQAQVELSEKTKETVYLGNSIPRIVFLFVDVGRSGDVGPVNEHVISGEFVQTEDQG